MSAEPPKDAPPKPGPGDLIVVARIGGAFGVRGEVRLTPFTETPEGCVSYGPLLDARGRIVLTPTAHRAIKKGLAVTAPEIDSPETADSLRGTLLHVPRSALPEPGEDEFYFSDLVGLEVKTASGQRAGTVIAVHQFGAGDMIEIKPPKSDTGAKSYYHPFTREAVPKVDLAGGRLIIVPQVADEA